MKYLSAIAWLTTCLTAVAADSLKVPGESPLEFCNANRDHDAIKIEKVDISPNPPKPGKPLLVTFKGEIEKTITRGAYVKVVVKYVIPPGTYNVLANAYTDEDEAISCLKATVNFPRPDLLEEEL
ncbi:hypothetical protein CDD83_5071 [Cordyceps sp. RAO-2017]|nr:hypothetical protein CDD83_5071 [Cordyceps sp. RAO-2017]